MQESSNPNMFLCLHCNRRTEGPLLCSTPCRSAVSRSPQYASGPIFGSNTSRFADHISSVDLLSPFDSDLPFMDVSKCANVPAASIADSSEMHTARDLPEAIQHGLSEYSSSFDQVRNLKRQVSMKGFAVSLNH